MTQSTRLDNPLRATIADSRTLPWEERVKKMQEIHEYNTKPNPKLDFNKYVYRLYGKTIDGIVHLLPLRFDKDSVPDINKIELPESFKGASSVFLDQTRLYVNKLFDVEGIEFDKIIPLDMTKILSHLNNNLLLGPFLFDIRMIGGGGKDVNGYKSTVPLSLDHSSLISELINYINSNEFKKPHTVGLMRISSEPTEIIGSYNIKGEHVANVAEVKTTPIGNSQTNTGYSNLESIVINIAIGLSTYLLLDKYFVPMFRKVLKILNSKC